MRSICVHGHFYQPPRENPWLEAIEVQDSAYPYHDWNQRVTAECYAPNSASRILDHQDRITLIVNNYAQISYNFGPTVLSWLETFAPQVYHSVVCADQESRKRFGGHGSAMSQAYNHIIMPLANTRDKRTQVIWGLRDFERRFGRKPEAMWLPETAVDVETLEVLAEQGIKFTVLAPRQARRVRKIGSQEWTDVTGEKVDPTMAYRAPLPSGRTIDLFFYDGPISRGVAFERLLDNGERFAQRLLGVFNDSRTWPELVHIATDGETYGHHHHRGEMALSYALEFIRAGKQAVITNYGQYLEQSPPAYEAEIVENSSWSCIHGVERWRSNCGCNAGHPGWNQEWRGPLRAALDWLRDTLSPRFEEKAGAFLKDPWAARDGYIDIVLDRSPENLAAFLEQHATHDLSDSERVTVLKLMEMQRHLMLMYTSCGWFFDELSGLETVQVIQYACRAVQLAGEVLGDSIEAGFLEMLAHAKSNLPQHGDGANIYRTFAKAAAVDLEKLAVHYAISSLFKPRADQAHIYCYTVERLDYQAMDAGPTRLSLGRARFTSEITLESRELIYAVLHFGDHNLNCGIRPYTDEASYQSLVHDITGAFSKADIPEVLRVMDKELGSGYSLKSLFRDDQREILQQILEPSLNDAETEYRQIYERHVPLAHFLADMGVPLPKAIRTAAGFAINNLLRLQFSSEDFDVEQVQKLLDEAKRSDITLEFTTLEYTLRLTIERLFNRFLEEPLNLTMLQRLESLVGLARSLPFEIVLWRPQNVWSEILRTKIQDIPKRAPDDETARAWMEHFQELGARLGFRTPEAATAQA